MFRKYTIEEWTQIPRQAHRRGTPAMSRALEAYRVETLLIDFRERGAAPVMYAFETDELARDFARAMSPTTTEGIPDGEA